MTKHCTKNLTKTIALLLYSILLLAAVVVGLYLLNEIDALLQIHAEIDELPLDTFLTVLLLLKNEHVMVEELLQALVGVVDAQLLERVVLNTHDDVRCYCSFVLQQSNRSAFCSIA